MDTCHTFSSNIILTLSSNWTHVILCHPIRHTSYSHVILIGHMSYSSNWTHVILIQLDTRHTHPIGHTSCSSNWTHVILCHSIGHTSYSSNWTRHTLSSSYRYNISSGLVLVGLWLAQSIQRFEGILQFYIHYHAH